MNKLKKSKTKKVKNNVAEKLSKYSIRSDNLHVPLTSSSVLLKIRPSVSGLSTSKYKKPVKNEEREKYITMQKGVSSSPLRLSSIAPRANKIPDNVAVHFASFYHEQKARLPHSGDERLATLEKGSKNSPKMEFTRQMVHKLEHSAGTQHYGREVSTLLENTVESPGFDLRLPPADNCAPQFGKSSNYFPLWYKDPSKMPLQMSAGNKCYVLKESNNECQETVEGRGGEDRKTSSSESLTDSLSSSSSSDTDTDAEVELDTETGSKKISGMRISRRRRRRKKRRNSRGKHDERIIGGGRAKSHLSTRSSRSSRSEITSRLSPDASWSDPRGKRFRDSQVCFFVDTKSSISDSFSRHSWSTRTSQAREKEEENETEEEEEEEEEGEDSVDWETTEDEDASVEVKVVSNDVQKIGNSIGGRKILGKL